VVVRYGLEYNKFSYAFREVMNASLRRVWRFISRPAALTGGAIAVNSGIGRGAGKPP
jgi:hypothetical protein